MTANWTVYNTPPLIKTKVQIVQELLDKRQITAQEAVTLLEKEIQYVYVPQTWYQPTPLFVGTNGDRTGL